VRTNQTKGCIYGGISAEDGPWPSFAPRSLEQDKATKCHGVPKDLKRSDLGPKQKHGAGDQQDILEDTSQCQNQPTSGSHQEYSGDVEQESDRSVGYENQRSNASQLVKGGEAFGERNDEEVDERANWRVVVKGNKRIHLEPVKEKLDHYESRSLESDSSGLGEEANEVEVQLSVRSEGYTGGNHQDNDSELLAGFLDTGCPGDQEDRDGREGLEHLNIRNTEVEIRGVTQDQARAEQEADGEDRADKHVLGDVNLFCSVQEVGGALQNPGANGSKREMPCNKEHRETEVERAVQVVVVQDDSGREYNPDRYDCSSRNPRF